MFGRHRFHQCAENLDAHILRQQRPEQFFRRLLVNVVHLRGAKLRGSFRGRAVCAAHANPSADRGLFGLFLFLFRHFLGEPDGRRTNLLNRKNLLHDQTLRNHRLEFVEHYVDGIDFFAGVATDHVFRQRSRLCKCHFAEHAHMLARYLRRPYAFDSVHIGLDLDRLLKLRQAARLHLRGGITPPQKVASLAANRLNVNVLSRL